MSMKYVFETQVKQGKFVREEHTNLRGGKGTV